MHLVNSRGDQSQKGLYPWPWPKSTVENHPYSYSYKLFYFFKLNATISKTNFIQFKSILNYQINRSATYYYYYYYFSFYPYSEFARIHELDIALQFWESFFFLFLDVYSTHFLSFLFVFNVVSRGGSTSTKSSIAAQEWKFGIKSLPKWIMTFHLTC